MRFADRAAIFIVRGLVTLGQGCDEFKGFVRVFNPRDELGEIRDRFHVADWSLFMKLKCTKTI
jgi:hypothetical protein